MSLAQRKRARALRERFGVAGGVRPAPAGMVCQQVDSVVVKRFGRDASFNELRNCYEPAKVISAGKGQCADHLAAERKAVRR